MARHGKKYIDAIRRFDRQQLHSPTEAVAIVKSFGAPIVAIVNQVQGAGPKTEGLSYSGFSTGATKVFLPNVTRRFFGYDVPFIIQNLGTVPTLVTAAFASFDVPCRMISSS